MTLTEEPVPDSSEADCDSLSVYEQSSRFVQSAKQELFEAMRIIANADTPEQAKAVREAGVPGIGLCRTEAMLLAPELSRLMRSIAAARQSDREDALSILLPLHQAHIEDIFSAISPYPAFIRLLDPPLQNFLPTMEQINTGVSDAVSDEDWDELTVMIGLRDQIANVSSFNPILGNRGCRLSLTNPEIMAMQVKAILQAAIATEQKGKSTVPAIVIPLVATEEETRVLVHRVREIVNEIFLRSGREIEYRVGVLIELPRAALCAGSIARHVDFVCFGTNDLTQMTFGFSKQESSAFLKPYLEQGILKDDPFIKLDLAGVGQLLTRAIQDIRYERPGMEIGVSGDHCGDDDAIRFFEAQNVDFVAGPLSCIKKLKPMAHI